MDYLLTTHPCNLSMFSNKQRPCYSFCLKRCLLSPSPGTSYKVMVTPPPSKKESMKASNIPLSGSDQGATFNWLMLSNPEYAATYRNHQPIIR
jgi:hypothetical protein